MGGGGRRQHLRHKGPEEGLEPGQGRLRRPVGRDAADQGDEGEEDRPRVDRGQGAAQPGEDPDHEDLRAGAIRQELLRGLEGHQERGRTQGPRRHGRRQREAGRVVLRSSQVPCGSGRTVEPPVHDARRPGFARTFRYVPVLALATLTACRGTDASVKKGSPKEGSLAEIGKLLADGTPVKGTQVEGVEPLEADPYALADPATLAQQPTVPQDPSEEEPVQRQDPYIRFGERIIVRKGVGGADFITKPYTMPVGKAKRLTELIGALEPFPFRARGTVDPATSLPFPLDPGVLEFQILDKWDEEYYSKDRKS